MVVKESDRKCLMVNIDVAEYDIAEKYHVIVLPDKIEIKTPFKCFLYCNEDSVGDISFYYPTSDRPLSPKGLIFGECVCIGINYDIKGFSIFNISETRLYGIIEEVSDHAGYTPSEFFHNDKAVAPKKMAIFR
jgi:hypothetical protein